MKREIKIYVLAILVVTIAFSVAAVSVNHKVYTFIPNDENLSNMTVSGNISETMYDSMEEKNGAKGISLQRVLDESTLIVKVEAKDEREMRYFTVLTKVTVLDVYTGDKGLKGRDIYIYEPIVVNVYKNNEFIILYEGYVLMKPGKTYYLFLSPDTQPQGFVYSDRRLHSYKLTERHYGKYPIETCDIKCEFEQDPDKEMHDYEKPRYREIMPYDLVVFASDPSIDYEDLDNALNHPVAREYLALWKEVKSLLGKDI
jgi:hypothetical protein